MTLMGKGGFPEDHELCLGMPGMHGTAYANYALHEADLIIAVGTRFDDRVTGKLDRFAPRAKFIHIDMDPAEIGKNVAVALPIVGDVKSVLTSLVKKVAKTTHPEWHQRIVEWKRKHPLRWKNGGGHQAAVRHSGDSQGLQGRRDHHHGSGAEPDVGRAVL